MAPEQLAIIGILAVAMAAFVANRWRPEIIALLALAATAALGLITPASVFAGLSDPAVITVIEILMLAQLLARSGVVDRLTRPVLARIKSERQLLIFLLVSGAAVSVFMNNIGALVIMMPVAYSGCRLLSVPPRRVLMPLSFATLLGGMSSLIGTPANLVVSAARADSLGAPFDFFSFAIVGGPAAIAGIVWLAATQGGRAVRKATSDGSQSPRKPPRVEGVLFEAHLSPQSTWLGKSPDGVEHGDAISILNVVRDGEFIFARREMIALQENDIVVAIGDHRVFDRLLDAGEVSGDFPENTRVVEAVVPPSSVLVGSSVGALLPIEAHEAHVIGLRGAHLRADGRLDDVRLSVGDVIIVAGNPASVSAAIEESGCLALAARRKSLRRSLTPLAALALLGGVIVSVLQIAPPEIAFGVALLVVAVGGGVSLGDLIRRIDWRVVLMLAALIPVAGAFENTGAAATIARTLFTLASLNEVVLIAAVWLIAVLITPFLNNVATAAILAPIALGAAELGGASADALLLAVVAGASTDFLTPFGHHNNTIVMGAAGYDLRDFLRRGGPLTIVVGVVTIISLAVVF